jgi:release factor glutamine methyltransferase
MTGNSEAYTNIVRALRAGTTRFLGIEMFVAEGALVPREETELLGRTAVDLLRRESGRPLRVIDMCCGSGNLACAIATLHSDVEVWASDLTNGAVTVARQNVRNLGLDARITVVQGDLFAPLAGQGLEQAIDMVVCNPPYISTGKLSKEGAELLAHEPREAFDGGPYGVSIFQRVLREAVAFLKHRSHLLFEIGVGQERQVTSLFARTGIYEPATTIANAAGAPRVVVARKR